MYDQRTRAGNPRNPAKVLYNQWFSILDQELKRNPNGRLIGNIYFGHDRGYGIGPFASYHQSTLPVSETGSDDRPHLCFGYAGYGAIGQSFIVTVDGEFRLGGFHGYESRNRVARNTFLDWDYYRSGYQWFVNTSDDLTPKFQGARILDNWRTPMAYVPERAVVAGYRRRSTWLKLERDPSFVGGWRIEFSRVGDEPTNTYFLSPLDEEVFRRYERIRARRYRLMREEELLASGAMIQRGKKRIETAEIEQRKNLQALALAAHFDVRIPAKTTPLKRTSEEEVEDGNDLDTHDQDAGDSVATGER